MAYIAHAFGPEIQVAEIGIDINRDGDRVVTKAYSRSDERRLLPGETGRDLPPQIVQDDRHNGGIARLQ